MTEAFAESIVVRRRTTGTPGVFASQPVSEVETAICVWCSETGCPGRFGEELACWAVRGVFRVPEFHTSGSITRATSGPRFGSSNGRERAES